MFIRDSPHPGPLPRAERENIFARFVFFAVQLCVSVSLRFIRVLFVRWGRFGYKGLALTGYFQK